MKRKRIKNLNKKGFAVTTMLYGLVFVTIAIFFGTISIVSNHKDDNDNFVEDIRDSLPEENNNQGGSSGGVDDGETSSRLLTILLNEADSNSENKEECKYEGLRESYNMFSGTNDCINFNYVWYSGKLWRIITKEPFDFLDGKESGLSMITEEPITELVFGSTTYSKNAWIYQWLNEDFKDTLYNYQNILVQNVVWSAFTDYYDEYEWIPLNPLYETEWRIQSTVGLLTAFEYYNSSFSQTSLSYWNTKYNYKASYLKNGDYQWWTLTSLDTKQLVTIHDNQDNYDSVDSIFGYSGYSNTADRIFAAVRPVVQLKLNTIIYKGTGTKEDPYIIYGDIDGAAPNTTLLNSRVSGEYVNFDGNLYRIMNIESDKTTKLIMEDVIKDKEGKVVKKAFSNNSTYGKGTTSDEYWDYYLNNTWYNSISENYQKMMTKGTYYLGKNSYNSYKATICKTVSNTVTTKACAKTTSKWTGYVGLPRIGEMFISTLDSDKSYWLITPYNTSQVFAINNQEVTEYDATESFAVRPTITLSSEVVIVSGDGRTPETAYEIALPE